MILVRREPPKVIDGEVVHPRDCAACGGTGRYVICTRHAGYNCSCPGREVRCFVRYCEDGEVLDRECDCGECLDLIDELAADAAVEFARRKLELGLVFGKAGAR